MAIEIGEFFPLKMVIFHSYINVYRRVEFTGGYPVKPKNGNGAVPLGHQWHRATRCSWTLLWRRACLAHVHIVWNQLTWHIRIPFFPYFFLYSKIHEKSHFTTLFWPSTSPSFFFFGLDGMISCSFLENPHLPHTIHVFYWADTREKWSNLNL